MSAKPSIGRVGDLPRRDLGWDMESPSLGSGDGFGCEFLAVPASFGDLEPLKT
jgi:hypothetical protein